MILLVDNYDSFTYNLVQSLRGLGAAVEVHRNDAITVAAIERRAPTAVVLSPGPGRPEDAGITPEVVRRLAGRVPLFGVCLGLQAIGLVYGARIVRARPWHGKSTPVRHDRQGLFRGLPEPLTVGRYHSLVIDRASLPDALAVTAATDDDDRLVMAAADRERRLWGVQFHPESCLTPDGDLLLGNFLAMARCPEVRE